MLSAELDDSTRRFCVLVYVDANILVNNFHTFSLLEPVLRRG